MFWMEFREGSKFCRGSSSISTSDAASELSLIRDKLAIYYYYLLRYSLDSYYLEYNNTQYSHNIRPIYKNITIVRDYSAAHLSICYYILYWYRVIYHILLGSGIH